MTEASTSRAPAGWRRLAIDAAQWIESPLMAVEAWVGAIFSTLLCLMLGVPLLLAAITAPFTGEVSLGWAVLFVVMALLWLRFDATHLYRTWSCVRRGERPLTPAVAERQPVYVPVLRPVAAFWMLGHFMLGVSFALMSERMSPPGLRGTPPLGYQLFVTAMALAYTFAANGFLLAAVKALTGSNRWVRRVWSCRIVIDLGVVVVSIVPFTLSRAIG